MVTMTMLMSFSITGDGDEDDGYEDEDGDDNSGEDDDGDGGDGALPQQPFLITSAPSASKLPISIHPVMATMILMIFQLVDDEHNFAPVCDFKWKSSGLVTPQHLNSQTSKHS